MFKKAGTAVTLALALAVASAVISPAMAYDETSTTAINTDKANVIVKGYDTVAYFAGKAVQGDKKFAVKHDGATYYFSSAANMKTFQANPSHYAPQFGGFCAMGAALGKKLDVDPTQYVVHNGKLYLNVNADVFKMFSQDIPGNVAKADANWPAIKDKAPNTL